MRDQYGRVSHRLSVCPLGGGVEVAYVNGCSNPDHRKMEHLARDLVKYIAQRELFDGKFIAHLTRGHEHAAITFTATPPVPREVEVSFP